MYMYVNKRVELAQRGIAPYKIYVLLLLLLLLLLLCEDPWRCICFSNSLPQDFKHFPGLQQQHLLALHFWTTSECSGDDWIFFGMFISQTAWRRGQEANGTKVNVVRCYLWHYHLSPGKASWGTMRTRVTCFFFFVFFFFCFFFSPKKLKELKFLAKYSSPLAVTAWSHHPQK